MAGQELASRVSCQKAYAWDKGSIDLASPPWTEQWPNLPRPAMKGGRFRVVAYDYGIKQNILRMLIDHHCEVLVVPAQTPAEDVLGLGPDGVFLSNGPGDPEPVDYAVENIRKLMGKVPVFGICLGHQLCGLALGGKTFKLKFGHHGSNHPVHNLLTDKVEITAQNHGFLRGSGIAALQRRGNHSREFERSDQRGHAPQIIAAVQRAVSSRGFSGAARFALFVHQFTDMMKEWQNQEFDGAKWRGQTGCLSAPTSKRF